MLLIFALGTQAAEDDEDFLASDPKASAEFEKLVAATPPSADNPQELCIFLHQRRMAYLGLGRYEQSMADLKQALLLKQTPTPDLWCDRWRMQSGISTANYTTGDWLARIEYAQTVPNEYQSGNKWRQFYSQLWLIDPYVYLGRLKDAEQALQRASNVVSSLCLQKDWDLYGNSVLSWQSTYAAWIQELRGNYSEAEILARQSLQETLSRTGKYTLTTAQALGSLAYIKLQQGQIDDSLRLRELALSALEGSGTSSASTFLAASRAEIGFLLGVQNRLAAALKVFEQRDQGLRSNTAQFAKTGSSNLNWAISLLKNQRPDEAETMLRGLVNFNLKKPFVAPLYLAHLRGYLAVVLANSGKSLEALAEFREAFPVLVRQAETDNASENGGFVRQYRLRLIAEAYLELLARLATDQSSPAGFDPVVAAFRVAEVARGSSVQQAIASSAARASLPDVALAELARKEQDTANQISALNKLLIRLSSAAESQRLGQTIIDIRNDVSRLETQHSSLRQELAERYPAYAELVSPKAPVPAEIQKVLQKNEAAIALYVAEHKTYVWTITPTQVAFLAIDLSRQKIDAEVASLRRSFDLSSEKMHPFDTATARNLYATLLAPDEALWNDTKLLNVIPHGSLGQLPFAVLLTSASSAKNLSELPWLLKKVAIAQQPSVGTLISLRAQGRSGSKRQAFVGFGDPLFFAQAPGKAAGTRSVRNLTLVPVRDELIDHLSRNGSSRAAELLPDIDSSTLQKSFAQIPALPDTADELYEIGRTLGANLKTDIFLGKRAT